MYKIKNLKIVFSLIIIFCFAFYGICVEDNKILALYEPPDGNCLIGANINMGEMSPAEFNKKTGFNHAIFVNFYHFPIKNINPMLKFMEMCKKEGAIALITLEPFHGLDSITQGECAKFADLCVKADTAIIVRFAHEMNGSWYPWGQQPEKYKDKFRLLSNEIRKRSKSVAMLWAPNHGAGYPFLGGNYIAKPNSSDYSILDTNNDGKITINDNMYWPYYPGDHYVDWVGMTIYHWGDRYPWGENEVVKAKAFAHALCGDSYSGDPVPDFYAMFCNSDSSKPLMIPETAALYNIERNDGASESMIKLAWIEQLYHIDDDTSDALNIATHFPKLKAINWFNHKKYESEAKGVVDWRITNHLNILKEYKKSILKLLNGKPYFIGSAQ